MEPIKVSLTIILALTLDIVWRRRDFYLATYLTSLVIVVGILLAIDPVSRFQTKSRIILGSFLILIILTSVYAETVFKTEIVHIIVPFGATILLKGLCWPSQKVVTKEAGNGPG